MEFKAFKMDGLGNDFLIIDRRNTEVSLTKEEIIKLGRRDNIGFDQIIFIEKEQDQNIIPITIYNSDGNEVSACGNGSRCIAYIVSREKKRENILLRTSNRILKADIISDFKVRINMGSPIFDWQKIPLSKNIDYRNINLKIEGNDFKEGFALNVGNPHIVFFVKNCFNYDLKKIGPLIENHELFPEKTNVTFAQVIDKNNIKVNVWERGAGLTKACGTAACATAVAGNIKGLSHKSSNIEFNEGILNLEYEDQIFMTGPVSEIKKINVKV